MHKGMIASFVNQSINRLVVHVYTSMTTVSEYRLLFVLDRYPASSTTTAALLLLA
jgi:hypothetical protein